MSKLSYKIFDRNKDKKNLLLLLHGYGSDENDLLSLAEYLPSNYFIVSLRAPNLLYNGAYSWFDLDLDNIAEIDAEQAISSKNKILKFIDFIIDKYQLSNEVSLMGFSQGAIMGFAAAFDSDKVSKLVAIGGFCDSRITNLEKKDNLDILLMHGEEDEVVPIAMAELSSELLTEAKCSYEFKRYDTGHNIDENILKDMIGFLA